MGSKKNNLKRASMSDYIAYAAYRFVEIILQILPLELVCIIGAILGQLAYYVMPERRSIVIRNLRITYGDQLSSAGIKSLARKTFRYSGSNLFASIPASAMSKEELANRVQVEGIDNLRKASHRDKGCIMLLAHMGNWEILTQIKVLIPEMKSTASLYRPLNNPLLDDLVKRRRQKNGTQLFSRKDGFNKPIALLKSKGFLGVIADQHAGYHGIAIPFFGKMTSMTSLPALLHRKTGAPILPVSMITTGLGTWKVIFHPSIKTSESEKKTAYLITARCANAYEQIMSESPADVLWMHRYWKVIRDNPLRICGNQKKKTGIEKPSKQVALKPFNILIYLGDTPANQPEISTLIDRLKHYRTDVALTIVGSSPEHACASFTIKASPGEPPHLLTNAIVQQDLSQNTPFDCAFELSRNNDGGILHKAGLPHIFALHGKYQNSNKGRTMGNNPNLSPSQFLDNLGLPIN